MVSGIIQIKTLTPPDLDEKEVLRFAGVRKGNDASELLPLLRECALLATDKLSYRLCYRELEISFCEDELNLGFMTTRSRALQKNLSGCHSIVLFSATVGLELDRLIAKYAKISPARALMLQAIGAERVEALCDTFCHTLSLELSMKGERLHPRFSPGFADFPLCAQADIFAALECKKHIGVSLGESFLMSPTKSVTAIAGISKM